MPIRLAHLLIAIAFTILVRPADAVVHSVCPNGCDFTRIAAAVAASSNGDEIVLAFTRPTIHTEAAIVIEKNLTIRGFGRDETIVQAAATAAAATDRIFTIQNGGSVFLWDLTLRHGRESFGGAIRVLGSTGLTSDLSLQRVGVHGNVATGNGGGLIGSSDTTVTIVDSVFEANVASDGGGLYSTGADITIIGSLFAGNAADAVGGGIYASGGDLSMWNTTITGNIASFQSGGVDIRTGIPSLRHVTIVDNSAPSVGGFNFLAASVRSSVIANNGGGDCVREITGANLHNWDSDGSCGIGVVGSGDPELEPLRDNGGWTRTRAPQEESPLIDAGDQTRCANSDQRGLERRLGGDCDIGAYERYELETCETVNLAIPDDDPTGVSHTVLLNTPDGSADRIVDVNASIFVLHDAVGDLTVHLGHDGIRVP
ncbi:MAG: choice-of-anchor Q domain-containing protein, partial [Acidobacteriota bacterium]